MVNRPVDQSMLLELAEKFEQAKFLFDVIVDAAESDDKVRHLAAVGYDLVYRSARQIADALRAAEVAHA